MENFFTVIGGMGTKATELYVKMVNDKTPAEKDQDYLNYVLVNYATIPDRSSYIMDKENNENPLPYLLDVIKTYDKLSPDFFVLTCNTAHYFFDELEKATDKPLLHMPKLAISRVSDAYAKNARVGIIGTEGTIKNKIYDPFIEEAGFNVVHPTKDIQDKVSTLIFDKIKHLDQLDHDLYHEILDDMFNELNCDVIVLGCTELSMMEDAENQMNEHVIDPQNVLAEETVALALQNRK
ncbi:aspartate/glutamate racemase family protein [Vagococcus luciliae]|uniref:Aspartate racemase n=1 Tax=Vagococcus luciliae TaxID=2920380 RepID=A0ABY5NZV6_9ENTE|nr:amino acid racemase [Vagococcus luciliae]UUV99013.1 Aspartate racemase [Vagococcus luciliae]